MANSFANSTTTQEIKENYGLLRILKNIYSWFLKK